MFDPSPPPGPPIELAYETPPPHGSAPMLVRLAGIFILVSTGLDLLYGAAMLGLAILMSFVIPAMVAAAPAPAAAPIVAPAPIVPAVPGASTVPGVVSTQAILPEAPAGPGAPPATSTATAVGPGAPGIAPLPGAAPGPIPPAPPAVAPPPMALFYAYYGTPGVLSLLVIAPKIICAVKLLKRRQGAWGWGLAGGIICCAELWMFIGCCFPVVLPLATGVYTIVILCFEHVRKYLTLSPTN